MSVCAVTAPCYRTPQLSPANPVVIQGQISPPPGPASLPVSPANPVVIHCLPGTQPVYAGDGTIIGCMPAQTTSRSIPWEILVGGVGIVIALIELHERMHRGHEGRAA